MVTEAMLGLTSPLSYYSFCFGTKLGMDCEIFIAALSPQPATFGKCFFSRNAHPPSPNLHILLRNVKGMRKKITPLDSTSAAPLAH